MYCEKTGMEKEKVFWHNCFKHGAKPYVLIYMYIFIEYMCITAFGMNECGHIRILDSLFRLFIRSIKNLTVMIHRHITFILSVLHFVQHPSLELKIICTVRLFRSINVCFNVKCQIKVWYSTFIS